MRSFNSILLLMVIVFVGLLMSATYEPVSADQANTATKKVKPKDTSQMTPLPRAKMKAKKVSNPIEVTLPRRGDVRPRGGYNPTRIHWKYNGGNQEPKNNFRVKILKNSDRSWSVDLGRNNNRYVESLAYERVWPIPEEFPVGTDYFARIIHIPSGATSHSKLFTIE